MLALTAPLFALAFAASTAPAAPAVSGPPPAPVPAADTADDAEREVGAFFARRLPDGSVLLSPGRRFVFTPGPDDPASPPRWIQLVLPAGTSREYEARTETLIVVPKGAMLELSNLIGDIRVDGWNRDQVRVVAEHGRRDRLQARVVELSRRVELMRRRAEELRRRLEADQHREEADQHRAEADFRRQKAELERMRAEAAKSGAVLHLETVNRLGVPTPVQYEITVPHWMAVKLSGMESDITVEGVRAAVAAASVRGDVRVRGGRGPVEISSVEGAVRASDCDGSVQASSINNDVELDDMTGALTIQSINGDIQIGKVTSRDVNASSVNGTIVFRGAFEPNGRYRLASHAGNLVVGVPVDAGVDVSVATFQGGFRTAFPIQVGPWRKGEKFNFVLGSGGSSLELESFQGLIELLRPAEVPAVAPPAQPSPKPGKVRIVKRERVPKPPPAPKAPGDDQDQEEED